jgi:hypothetical protein
MKNLLTVILIIQSLVTFGQVDEEIYHTSDFNLKGNVQSVTVTLVGERSFEIKRKKWQKVKYVTSLDTIRMSCFEFSEQNKLITKVDSNFDLIRFIPQHNLDSTRFRFENDVASGYEVVSEIMKDSTEYEIHYRKYDDFGQLVFDSTSHGKQYEMYYEGAVISQFTYDVNGNVKYSLHKASFIFYFSNNSYYVYLYDIYGNWVEKRKYYIKINEPYNIDSLPDIDWDDPNYITYRQIKYY